VHFGIAKLGVYRAANFGQGQLWEAGDLFGDWSVFFTAAAVLDLFVVLSCGLVGLRVRVVKRNS